MVVNQIDRSRAYRPSLVSISRHVSRRVWLSSTTRMALRIAQSSSACRRLFVTRVPPKLRRRCSSTSLSDDPNSRFAAEFQIPIHMRALNRVSEVNVGSMSVWVSAPLAVLVTRKGPRAARIVGGRTQAKLLRCLRETPGNDGQWSTGPEFDGSV